jgi:hypothetical protein
MIIDTKEEASTLRKTKNFAVIIYILLCVLTVIPGFAFSSKLDPSIKFIICGALSVAFLIFYWYQYKMEYTYLYFSNNSSNLVFRFYSLRTLYGKPKTIEIAKTNFVKYDIITSFFDKKDSLVLYQRTPKGIAKYPPIPLSLLTKQQKTELKRALFAIVR